MIQIIVAYVIAAIIYICTIKEYPYYKAFQIGVINLYCYALLWNETYLMGRECFAYFNANEQGLCVLCVLLCGCMGGSTILVVFFCNTELPIIQFWHDYKSVNKDKCTPRISYSLFKKMRRLQPDYFEEINDWYSHNRLACLKYHGKPYRLSLPDYILAMLYISREKKHNVKNNTAERELYAVMQADLEKQMDKISNEKKSALADIERATENTINIIGNMTRK